MRFLLCCTTASVLLLDAYLACAAARGDVFSADGSGDARSVVLPSVPTGFTAERTRTVAGNPVRRRGNERAVAFA